MVESEQEASLHREKLTSIHKIDQWITKNQWEYMSICDRIRQENSTSIYKSKDTLIVTTARAFIKNNYLDS
jgi:hypothetical protein